MKLSSVYIGILPLLLHGGLAKALVKEGGGISGKIAARFRQFFENPDAQGLQNDYTQPYGYETSTTATLALTGRSQRQRGLNRMLNTVQCLTQVMSGILAPLEQIRQPVVMGRAPSPHLHLQQDQGMGGPRPIRSHPR